jgi:hypothetical protein
MIRFLLINYYILSRNGIGESSQALTASDFEPDTSTPVDKRDKPADGAFRPPVDRLSELAGSCCVPDGPEMQPGLQIQAMAPAGSAYQGTCEQVVERRLLR